MVIIYNKIFTERMAILSILLINEALYFWMKMVIDKVKQVNFIIPI